MTTLDPYLAARIHLLSGLDWDGIADPEARSRFDEYGRDPGEWTMPDVDVVDHAAPGPHGDVTVRVYTPPAPAAGALLWVHGGGFWGGDLDMPESSVVAAELASRAGIVVASVGYRLAVDGVRYPVPLDDVVAAWEWFVRERPAASPVCLGGASAGGALALAAAIRLRDAGSLLPAGLFLAYPVVHFPVPALDDATAAAMRSLPPLLRFPPSLIEEMFANYVGRLGDLPPLATPGHAPLGGLPAVHLVSCELDDLRPSADLLARQLAEAGVEVRAQLAAGMPHGHLNRTPTLDGVDRSLAHFAAGLRALNGAGEVPPDVA
ncbi:alpha/beta hydrolase fold domain-containing protein [Phytohabitans aurantiacus]|uniref:Esterase n=1 Tax=Phytohabitans aurantiacus TaxID=3016789 RepID=A0ABQ5R2I6_9ACTN|nr:alpha/beta hydrolase fold domain-containing protein [Phytohabitans aurantiacus]GLI00984.1 esterase [Phytohabitans aurantiacus]